VNTDVRMSAPANGGNAGESRGNAETEGEARASAELSAESEATGSGADQNASGS